MEGLIYDGEFTVFALFYSVFESNFQVQASRGAIFGGAIEQKVFCVMSLGGLYLEGLIHGGAYFRNFTVCVAMCSYGWLCGCVGLSV